MSQDDRESSPLLRRVSPTSTSTSAEDTQLPQKPSLHSQFTAFLRRNVILILYLYMVVVEFGNYLQNAPRAAIYEDLICFNEYSQREELDCKSHAVQDELAFVRGIQEMLECLPGLFLAMPYGFLANRHGRKMILFVALIGMCLQYTWVLAITSYIHTHPSTHLSLRYVWFSAAFLVIGGGPPVSRSLAFVIVSDVTESKNRAAIFFQLEAVALVARAIAAGLSSYMMKGNSWLPMVLGVGFIYTGSMFALLLPATNNTDEPGLGSGTVREPASADEPDEATSLLGGSDRGGSESMLRTIWKAVSGDRRVVLILTLVILGQFASRTTFLLLQYASKRYHWTFGEANMLLVERMIVTTVALLTLVPSLKFLLPRLPDSIRPKSQDLFLTRLTTVFLAVGLILMAIATKPSLMIAGVAVFSWGFCAFSALRSVLTEVVLQREPASDNEHEHEHGSESETHGKNHISILYAAVSLGQTVAKAAAGPFYAYLFAKGQRLGEMGQGLPFAVAAALAAVVHLGTWLLSLA